MTTARYRRAFCRVRVHGGRAGAHPAFAQTLARPSVPGRHGGQFHSSILPETGVRIPRGEVSAFMIEIALRHPRAAMAGAHPAPLEKTS